MKILINLIGGQPAPNYIAVIETKSDRFINLYSSSTKQHHSNLCNVLSNLKWDHHFEVDAYDFENVQKVVSNIFNEYGKTNELILNLTGGTKIMSIAAFIRFNELHLPMVYVDTQNDKIISFSTNSILQREISCNIRMKDYFLLHGQVFPDHKNKILCRDPEFGKTLELMFESNQKINPLVVDVAKIKPEKIKSDISFAKGKSNISWNNKEKSFTLEVKKPVSKTIKLSGIESFKFFTGGWFEEKVYLEILSLKYFDEVNLNVKLPLTLKSKDKNDNPKNEIDIVAIKKDVMYIFECKSGGVRQEDINKLRAIKELFGTYARVILVNYFRINNATIREKINEFRIECLIFNNKENDLKKFVSSIISGKTRNINL